MDAERRLTESSIPGSLKTAVSLMKAHFRRTLSVEDIANRCGVSQRALQYQFRTFFNLSPAKYLERLRLNAAREALLKVRSKKATITEVAEDCGFRHLGRFSQAYRTAFGEAPSQTLKRALIAASTEISHVPGSPPQTFHKPSLGIFPPRTSEYRQGTSLLGELIFERALCCLATQESIAARRFLKRSASAADLLNQASRSEIDYFLDMSLIVFDDVAHLTLHLVDTKTGYHLWGEQIDSSVNDIEHLQEALKTALEKRLLNAIQRSEINQASRNEPENLNSYQLAMRALPLVQKSQTDATRRAMDLLNQAVELDPDCALANALMAWGHSQFIMYNTSNDPASDRERAVYFNKRAQITDPGDPLVLTARSSVHMMLGDFEQSMVLAEKATAAEPWNAWAWSRSGWLNAYEGRYEIALKHFQHALSVDMYQTSRDNVLVGIGTAYFGAEKYDRAIHYLNAAVGNKPGMWWANRSLSVAYDRMGEHRKAQGCVCALRQHAPGLTVSQVVSSVPFRPDFLNRLGEGLDAIGLPA